MVSCVDKLPYGRILPNLLITGMARTDVKYNLCKAGAAGSTGGYKNTKAKSRQHPDFPGGHPPEYYPSLRLLNFTERTGYGVLSLRWPSTSVLHITNHTFISTQTTNLSFLLSFPHTHHTFFLSHSRSLPLSFQHTTNPKK